MEKRIINKDENVVTKEAPIDRDILKLYLGHRVRAFFDDDEILEITGILESLNLESAQFSHQIPDYYFHKPEFVLKPILRTLSSLTEKEAEKIGRIWQRKPDSIKWRVEHKNGYLKIYRKHYSKNLTIDYVNGDIDFYDGDDIDTSLNQLEIFLYLISKGFDLFELIERGQALDSNKI